MLRRITAALLIVAGGALYGCGGGSDDGGDVRRFRVPSEAMVPTLKVGDVVDADFTAYAKASPKRGDIVLFTPPAGVDSQECGVPTEPADGHPCEKPAAGESSDNKFVKRVVGLPGEWLEVKDNHTYIGKSRDGPYERQSEPFIAPGTPCDQLCNLPKPIRVPDGHFFTMGDNRGVSDDSRSWGPIPRRSLLAKVLTK
jgi:signal peptidase I